MLRYLRKSRVAGAVALALTMGATSLSAGGAVQVQRVNPIAALPQNVALESLVLANHDRNRWRGRGWCREHPRRCHALNNRGHDRPRFLRGHRGSKFRRFGHRQHNDGWWYPFAAFALGAYIVNQHHNNQVQGHGGWSHINPHNMTRHDNWCDWKYRSYSRRTKTFQPFHGGRKLCNSPFDRI